MDTVISNSHWPAKPAEESCPGQVQLQGHSPSAGFVSPTAELATSREFQTKVACKLPLWKKKATPVPQHLMPVADQGARPSQPAGQGILCHSHFVEHTVCFLLVLPCL